MYKKLVFITTIFTFIVIIVGAYVRLSDAGLGCPDWPGCYGHFTLSLSEEQQKQANKLYPDKPVENHLAFKEMFHRLLAGTLGMLILLIAILACIKRKELNQNPLLPIVLVGMVLFQAILGKWTVTLLLKPAIVTAHLLGGMIILAALTWLSLRQFYPTALPVSPRLKEKTSIRYWALLGLLLLFFQISLGGWVSSNYAALACYDFPLCDGKLIPKMDFTNAFHFIRELGMNADGSYLSLDSLTAIHWAHRLGAIIVFLYLSSLAILLMLYSGKKWAVPLLFLLCLQIGLGIANVLLSLPLAVAVAHNAGAALLLSGMIALNYQLWRNKN